MGNTFRPRLGIRRRQYSFRPIVPPISPSVPTQAVFPRRLRSVDPVFVGVSAADRAPGAAPSAVWVDCRMASRQRLALLSVAGKHRVPVAAARPDPLGLAALHALCGMQRRPLALGAASAGIQNVPLWLFSSCHASQRSCLLAVPGIIARIRILGNLGLRRDLWQPGAFSGLRRDLIAAFQQRECAAVQAILVDCMNRSGTGFGPGVSGWVTVWALCPPCPDASLW